MRKRERKSKTRMQRTMFVYRIVVLIWALCLLAALLFVGKLLVKETFAEQPTKRKSSEPEQVVRVIEKAEPAQEVEEVEEVAQPNAIPYTEYVVRVVTHESGDQTMEGQMAVAQCIRYTAEVTGQTTEQVVKVPGQYASPVDPDEVTDSVREACYRVFTLGERAVESDIRYFYSTADGFVSRWHENNLEYVCTIGAHKFFK